MPDLSKVVAVGLLTKGDLDRLGAGFRNHFPVPKNTEDFDELLKAIDVAIHARKAAQ